MTGAVYRPCPVMFGALFFLRPTLATRNVMKRGPWTLLPPVQRQHQNESLLIFFESLRGGGQSSDYSYYDDDPKYSGHRGDYYERRKKYYQNEVSGNRDSTRDSYDQFQDNVYMDDDYDDRGYIAPRSSSRQKQSLQPSFAIADNLPSILKTGNRQIGLTLLGAGTMLTMFGMSLFFNKTLMRLGNLLFMAGVPMTIGPSRTAGYFLQTQKLRSTICLVLGIVLVFVGHPIFGILLEAFGLLNLFGNMFPFVMALLKQLPIVGPLLSGGGGGGGGGRRRAPVARRRDVYDEDRNTDRGTYHDNNGRGDYADYSDGEGATSGRYY